jgi:hypothetical protein
MRAAAALQASQPVADVGLGGVRLVAQQRRRGHDPAVQAIAALRRLLMDEGRLQRVRVFRRADAGEGDDLGGADLGDRQRAGALRRAVDMHGAGAALAQSAAEAGVVEL